MQTVTVTLAGRDYEIEKLPIKANREWRKTFDEPINKLLGAATAVKELTGQDWNDSKEMLMQVGLILATHVDELTRVLLDSVDMIVDAVFAYSPILEVDRERIEAEGYDEEMIKAFVEVMQIAYPFSPVVKSLMKLGSAGKEEVEDGTSQNSPLPSGESGKTS